MFKCLYLLDLLEIMDTIDDAFILNVFIISVCERERDVEWLCHSICVKDRRQPRGISSSHFIKVLRTELKFTDLYISLFIRWIILPVLEYNSNCTGPVNGNLVEASLYLILHDNFGWNIWRYFSHILLKGRTLCITQTRL